MPRATNAPSSRARHKRRLSLASGFMGGRSKLFRTATEAVDHARAQATEHRKLKKREYRGLWIIRLGAACRQHGLTYSRFMEGVLKTDISLNRKMLSEIAIHDPDGFASIVAMVRREPAA